MDADTHKPPADFKVEGFPTIYYIPRHNNKPVLYEGERTADAMSEFLLSKKSVK